MSEKRTNNDPAFLFYSNDFISSTYLFTDEQVGQYIRALVISHTKGGKLTEKEIKRIITDEEILAKFSIDDEGLYYHQRMVKEIEARKKRKTASKENGSKGGNPNFKKGKHNPYYNPEDNLIDNPEDNQKINITLKDRNRNRNEDLNVIKDDLKESIKIIIDYLNLKLGTHYKYTSSKTQDLIKARFNEGFILDDFQRVIDVKVDEWKSDDKMSKFLRPETLFSNKFESYLNQNINLKKRMSEVMHEKYKKTGEIW